MADPQVHIFGVRHHGPGSARSLCRALEALSPDCVLIEGPPDAEEVLPIAADSEIKPPVALLIYDPDKPQRSVCYPFAVFSPEWQAIQFAMNKKIPLHFMDLPQSVQLAMRAEQEAKVSANSAPEGESSEREINKTDRAVPAAAMDDTGIANSPGDISRDPLAHLARAAGYSDSERWWEHLVEHRRDGGDVFTAVLEAMAALRDAAIQSSLQQLEPESEARREAHMRQSIRQAQKEGFERIAVVCGAWHAPALAKMSSAKNDAAQLKGLPKLKVSATWIPWTYGRLAFASGYGAGIESPGWYDFLWARDHGSSHDLATRWLVNVARLLRREDLDVSSANVIEAVRLAEALAALRGRPLPGLPELNEAAESVLCFGDALPLRLISEKLIVGERLGAIPDDTPSVPLARDLAREQKRLRFPPEPAQKQIDLDLRTATDLDRSRLLHRLNLLGIPWGDAQRHRRSQKGTFHELWAVQWQPDFAVALIESGVWGNTIAAAAGAKVRHEADVAPDLQALTALLDATLLADLPEAVEHLMSRLQAAAAVASDVGHLMQALAPLANILRYGNVRKTDTDMVAGVVNGLVARICIGLPGGCGSLNDEAAEEMFRKLLETHAAIGILQDPGHTAAWNAALRQLADSPGFHGLVVGRACRLLRETQQVDAPDAARRLGLALSTATAPAHAVAWVDSFLRNSGLLLLHDDILWQSLDDWISSLTADHFTMVLPLLRRTFSTFQIAERRQMGVRVISGPTRTPAGSLNPTDFDSDRASKALPLLAQLLGLNWEVKT